MARHTPGIFVTELSLKTVDLFQLPPPTEQEGSGCWSFEWSTVWCPEGSTFEGGRGGGGGGERMRMVTFLTTLPEREDGGVERQMKEVLYIKQPPPSIILPRHLRQEIEIRFTRQPSPG